MYIYREKTNTYKYILIHILISSYIISPSQSIPLHLTSCWVRQGDCCLVLKLSVPTRSVIMSSYCLGSSQRLILEGMTFISCLPNTVMSYAATFFFLIPGPSLQPPLAVSVKLLSDMMSGKGWQASKTQTEWDSLDCPARITRQSD